MKKCSRLLLLLVVYECIFHRLLAVRVLETRLRQYLLLSNIILMKYFNLLVVSAILVEAAGGCIGYEEICTLIAVDSYLLLLLLDDLWASYLFH